MREAEAEFTQARDEEAKAQDELDYLRARTFRRYAKNRLLHVAGVIENDELADLIADSGSGLSDRGIAKYIAPWVAQLRAAFECADEHLTSVPRGQATSASVAAAVLAEVPGIDPDLARDVAEELSVHGKLGYQDPIGRLAGSLAYSPEVAAADRQTRARRMDDAEARFNRAQSATQRAEARFTSLEVARARAARPEGLGRIVGALLYLAAACVIAPLTLMTWGRTTLPAWSRGVVVALFVSGLIAFLLVVVDLLRDHPERDQGRTTGQPARDGTEDASGPEVQA